MKGVLTLLIGLISAFHVLGFQSEGLTIAKIDNQLIRTKAMHGGVMHVMPDPLTNKSALALINLETITYLKN